ncbi:MAG TPA: pitrilysin family protein [Reyranellaceae bacterium]|nr:pitrilysin family protein [Reyranellaceae bacterium]
MLSPSRPALAKLLAVQRNPAQAFTLANGLQVIVLTSRRAPLVSQTLVYKVGSADETVGQTGAAHFLEHMMFKGTATIAPAEFSRTISRNGGRDNAYTTFDQTGYYQTIASDRLEMIMRMEADRMANLRITEQQMTPERQVVLEERRTRTENVPAQLLDEAVREALFGRNKAYGVPISGFPDDIRKLGVRDLTAFYQKHYAPNNAVLIIAGDTTIEAVRRLAEKYYGPVAAKKIEPRTRPKEPGPGLPHRLVRADARVAEPHWARDYIAPSYKMGETQHAYALQVLARLFGGGETGRLGRTLVLERKLAMSATAGYSAGAIGLSSFGLAVEPAPLRTIAEIEQAVAEEQKKLLDGGVTEAELERAQNRMLAQAIYAQDSMASGPRIYANQLGIGGTTADVEEWPQRISSVTTGQVVEAARHVWRENQAVTSLLVPAEGRR